ncbi:DUF342 domain-containing protein [Clostridium sp. D2Q-14]|uniref:DUF342 domain-containing protein n=1 Tax=Anaeromonas gelatinilytica TaxID=2683194 RepID=UPI00193B5C15|nr:FapA family protein [Anaeromonas gelatinilytica]MBS4536025.1 DUF342 domain-containing protein [Anaeromonas gelatinilytica]
MMENCIILEGKNKEKLLKEAIEHFNVPEEDLLINIIVEKNKLFTKYYKIEFKVNDVTDEKENINDEKSVDIKDEIDNKINSDTEEMDELLKDKCISESRNLKDDYSIQFTDEGIKLSVYNIENIKIMQEHIYSYIGKKNIDNLDRNKINEALNDINKGIIIAPPQKEFIIDDELSISISKDNMSVYIEIIQGDNKGKEVAYDNALKMLKEKVRYGLDKELLEEILKRRLYNKKFIIAEGKKTKKGKDGYIEYEFDDDFSSKPDVLDDGSVDFRNLGLINNVKKGEVLARVVSPRLGENGINILGEELSSIDGKPANIKLGSNASIVDDQIIAHIDGQVKLIDGKIEVLNVYNINGNVDSRTGNIKFNGTVSIKDSVNTGFEVEALGDVYVNGVVEDAFVKSNGNIYLARGIVGRNRATLEANGEIASKYIENSKVKAEEDIISEAILHSEVESNGNVRVQGKKGLIVGGKCKAQFGVHARTIGSPMETDTLIEVGTNIEEKEELINIRSRIDEIEKEIIKMEKSINILEKSYKENKLSDKKSILFKELLKTRKTLSEERVELMNKYEDIDDEIKKKTTGTIIVDEIIYPKVKIVIGSHIIYNNKIQRKCKFTLIDGNIKTIKL